jgi:hypothetical protein
LGLFIAYEWSGTQGVLISFMLIIMEISLSFDNAILNATVLAKMDAVWQKRFLTWGLFIAVFGLRFLFPILIVAIIAKLSLIEVLNLALFQPHVYSQHLHEAHIGISAFGGIFLLLVFLSFIFDQKREIHWLGKLEKKLNSIGKLEAMEIIITLFLLLILTAQLPKAHQAEALTAGIAGIIVFLMINSITALLAKTTKLTVRSLKHAGLMNFIYLEVLDASFSFDGVIGAFAITKDVMIIMIGLAIGAFFVRSLTLLLVHKRSLEKYLYLEHGAHYAIGALSVIMLMSMSIPIPELLTGLIGMVFIGLSFFSSVRHNNKKA